MYIISACLAGQNCKYNGGNNENGAAADFVRIHKCVLVCPELLGGLPVPRPPVEITAGRAVDKCGRDVTAEFKEGAKAAFEKAAEAARAAGDKIEGAVLKANSPSCGRGKIYDGSFTGKLADGDGFFAALLKEKGIRVITEKEMIV